MRKKKRLELQPKKRKREFERRKKKRLELQPKKRKREFERRKKKRLELKLSCKLPKN